MDRLLIFNMSVMFVELLINFFTVIYSLALFLNFRWSKRKSIFVFQVFNMTVVGGLALFTSAFVRMLLSSVSGFASVLLVTKDKFGKKCMVFLLFYTLEIFTESAMMNIVAKLQPEVIEYITMRNMNYNWVDKVLNYNYYVFFYVSLIMLITYFFMYLVHAAFGKNLIMQKSRAFTPFTLLVTLHVIFVFLTNYLVNTFINSVYVHIFHMAVQGLLMVMMLWIIWQMSETERRLRVEHKLAAIRLRNELDVKIYQGMQEQLLNNGMLRHDFYNQMQIIDGLLSVGERDNMAKANNIINELANKYCVKL